MSTGYIVAQIFTSRSAIPIERASVSVTLDLPKGQVLRGFRSTNAEGKTTPIEVETPPVELSQSPSNVKPFTSYTIRIDHPDYYTFVIKNAQVFANETSLQIASLIPLKEFETPQNSVNSFTVTPQNL